VQPIYTLPVQGENNFILRSLILASTIGLAVGAHTRWASAADMCSTKLEIAPKTLRAVDLYEHTLFAKRFNNHLVAFREMLRIWIKNRNYTFRNDQEMFGRALSIFSEMLEVTIVAFPHKKYPEGGVVRIVDEVQTEESLQFPKASLSKLAHDFIDQFNEFKEKNVETQFKDESELYKAMKNVGKRPLHLMAAILFSPEKVLIQEVTLTQNHL
jgi:hypothetical protein